MQIDTEHLHHWVQAIRQSADPNRTMDAFWRGQIQSKEWLIQKLAPYVTTPSTVVIHGGWVGTLSSLLFQSSIPVTHITSVDIDPGCAPIATMMNKLEEIDGRFHAITADMCDVTTDANIVINTSCEHLTQAQYDLWLSNIPTGSLIVIQSNNYQIPEHIRPHQNLKEFEDGCGLTTLWSGEFVLPLYTRFMIIGKIKNTH